MNILVTGAGGFIGGALCAQLLLEGNTVVGIDNSPDNVQNLDDRIIDNTAFHIVCADIRDSNLMGLLPLNSFDVVYHLACPTGVPNLAPLALEMLDTCYTGTLTLLKLSSVWHATFLLASSAEIYGDPLMFPQSENYYGNVDSLGPRNGYEEGKRVAEALVAIFCRSYGLDGRIARIFNTYGPGMRLDDSRVVPSLIRRAINGDPLIVYGDGEQTRCLTFISDTIRALSYIVRSGQSGMAYNVGNSVETSINELAKLILSICSSTSDIVFRPHFVEDHRRRLPNSSRLEALGWKAEAPLHEGLGICIQDVKSRIDSEVGLEPTL